MRILPVLAALSRGVPEQAREISRATMRRARVTLGPRGLQYKNSLLVAIYTGPKYTAKGQSFR